MTEKWKSTIGIELQELLRREKISQGKLADFLGLKAASVTYLLQGKIKMTQERLEQIMLCLHADSSAIQHFEELLCLENPPQTPRRSESNFAFFSCRCRVGLTAKQICEQTGISVSRLKELENLPEAVPSLEEIELLKKIYDCEAGVLWGIIPVKHALPERDEAMVREPEHPLAHPVQISVVDTAGLGRYRENCDFLEFLKYVRTGVETIEMDKKQKFPVAKIQFNSARLGWDTKGIIEIFLGMPETEDKPGLFLGRGTHGIFRMWKHRGHFWTPFFSAFGEKKSKPAWVLPVVNFSFQTDQQGDL